MKHNGRERGPVSVGLDDQGLATVLRVFFSQ